MSKSKKNQKPLNMDVFDQALEMLVKSGRVKRKGTLKRSEPDENGDSRYLEDIAYEMVLN